MNSIMKKLSCLVLVVCCFAVATAGDVTYSKKIKNVYSIEEITAKPASRDAVVNSDVTIITKRSNHIPIFTNIDNINVAINDVLMLLIQ